MAKFTLGIPTYNRPRFLRRALEFALAQTADDLEILVSDNSAGDEAGEITAPHRDRVRYHKNPSNIGMWPNLLQLADMAGGEYFSWLQDDDLIHRDFVRRATEAFTMADDVVFYASYALYSPSPTSINRWATIHGPLLPVEWMSGRPRVIDGLGSVPLCLFQSLAISPAIAFRTSALREAGRHILDECPLFNENIILARMLAQGRAVIDPWVGAIHIHHAEQEHLQLGTDRDEILRQILIFQRHFEEFLATLPDRWRAAFAECVREIPPECRVNLILQVITPERFAPYWASASPLALELRDILLEGASEKELEPVAWGWSAGRPAETRGIKGRVKKMVPPRLWDSARLLRRALSHGIEVRVR